MIQEYQLRILPEIAANEQKLKEYLSKEKGLNLRDITATRILKRSIDARQRTIFVNLKVRAYIREMPKDDEYEHTIYNKVEGKPQVSRRTICSPAPHRTGVTSRCYRTRKRRTRAEKRFSTNQQGTHG